LGRLAGLAQELPMLAMFTWRISPRSPSRNHRRNACAVGVKAQLVVDHVQPAGSRCGIEHRLRLARIHRGGLFTQHMGALGQRLQRLGRVQHRGRRNAHEIHRMGVEHRRPVVIGMGNGELRSGSLRRSQTTRGDGHHLGPRHMAQRGQIGGLRETRADDGNFHGISLSLSCADQGNRAASRP
jgi:hypothetical protein